MVNFVVKFYLVRRSHNYLWPLRNRISHSNNHPGCVQCYIHDQNASCSTKISCSITGSQFSGKILIYDDGNFCFDFHDQEIHKALQLVFPQIVKVVLKRILVSRLVKVLFVFVAYFVTSFLLKKLFQLRKILQMIQKHSASWN